MPSSTFSSDPDLHQQHSTEGGSAGPQLHFRISTGRNKLKIIKVAFIMTVIFPSHRGCDAIIQATD